MKRSILAVTLLITIMNGIHAGSGDGKFDIFWVDVEGSAATLMVTPTGESILIDSGNPGVRDANRIVKVATQAAGLRRIDHLITTHYHPDHYGGASTLAKLVEIGKVYDNGVFAGMPDNPGTDYFEFECESRTVINPGDQIELRQTSDGPAVSLRCLGTRKQFIQRPEGAADNAAMCARCQPKDRDGSDNANSVVSLIAFGDFRFFDGGDLTWNQEMNLVCPVDLVGHVDLYQVTHHGLDSSNNPVVLNTIRPTIAVMNNGDRKGCLPEVFANLKGTESLEAVFQLHKNLRPGEEQNNFDETHIANHGPSHTCEGNYIHLAVATNAKSYTVEIPSTQMAQTFMTTEKGLPPK